VEQTHSSYKETQPVRRFYSSRRENRSKCKHSLVDISVQRVQLTHIILLNNKGSHHIWLSCMKCVVCSGTKLSSLRHKYMHSLQLIARTAIVNLVLTVFANLLTINTFVPFLLLHNNRSHRAGLLNQRAGLLTKLWTINCGDINCDYKCVQYRTGYSRKFSWREIHVRQLTRHNNKDVRW